MVVLFQILLILISAILAFFILIQPARGEGIASAFGGVGGESFFGTKAHQHMSRFTIVLSVLVLVLAVLINVFSRSEEPTKARPGEAPTPTPTAPAEQPNK